MIRQTGIPDDEYDAGKDRRMSERSEKQISMQTMRRLPVYLHYLKSICGRQETVSATMIAAAFGLNDVQVRKDLSAVSGSGKPKTGYVTSELLGQIEACLGCAAQTKMILVGAGHLGQALLSYEGFGDYGFSIAAAFDRDESLCMRRIAGKMIYPDSMIETFCRKEKISLAVIATPVQSAQEVCDLLVSCGITAIWNFAPIILRVPSGVLVENENLASSLAVLARHLRTVDTVHQRP